MKSKIIEHLAGVVFVTLALLAALWAATLSVEAMEKRKHAGMDVFGDLSFINFNSQFDLALLKDAINIYYPGCADRNDSLYNAVVKFKRRESADRLQSTRVAEKLTWTRFADILGMYLKFLLIYAVVMALTYYGVQTLAVFRFVYKKRLASSGGLPTARKIGRWFVAFTAGLGVFLLFCPAYVIAYSIRTEFNTDTAIFMVILGVVSNGVLITYANKFYAFLVAESRKGYVATAVVKNLHAGYRFHGADGISFSSILSPVKKFRGHVFDHIFRNARYQYLSTIKEQASFLITGLIIIEMALNIHGYLNYEMLRQLLYRNYSIVAVIMLLIFYTVKMTELFADYLIYKENMKYENRN
jgi:predicted DNA repair protein MutK